MDVFVESVNVICKLVKMAVKKMHAEKKWKRTFADDKYNNVKKFNDVKRYYKTYIYIR